jgi:hypothetical protein
MLSFKFDIGRSGIFFTTAGYVALELPSEGETGTEYCYRIQTRIN